MANEHIWKIECIHGKKSKYFVLQTDEQRTWQFESIVNSFEDFLIREKTSKKKKVDVKEKWILKEASDQAGNQTQSFWHCQKHISLSASRNHTCEHVSSHKCDLSNVCFASNYTKSTKSKQFFFSTSNPSLHAQKRKLFVPSYQPNGNEQ